MKPEKTEYFENEKSEEVKKNLEDPIQELSDAELDQVSGGFEGPERASFQAYCEEKMRESDIITTVPDLDNPHSKKQKGMLYK